MSSNVSPDDNSTSDGFLSGFVESTVEMPADGKNGDGIVHYNGEHSRYELMVTLVNGMREGEAALLNDGVPYLNLHYEKGSLTGIVERINEYGFVDMRGHLVNGKESGLFLEYDEDDKVVWTGYYRNGQRYSEVRNRVVKSGCLEDGSGEFYKLDENGLPTQLCLYVNGVKSRMIAQFNATIMTEYDENERRLYDGEFKGDMEHGFVREGKGKEFGNGGRVAVYSGEWKNGKRDGRGIEYKGFKPVYTGEWKDGKRNGKGKEMDERGKVVRSGTWVEGVFQGVKSGTIPKEVKSIVPKEVKSIVPKEVKSIVIPSSLASSPQTIKELIIGNNSYNDSSVTELKLSGLARLKRIVINHDCFGRVRYFELDGLSELESMMIGTRSFTIGKDWDTIKTSKRNDGTCRIVNCPKLKFIQIGERSFWDCHSFELNNLPSLQSIDIGVLCFYYVPSISLADLPQLQSVKLDGSSFARCHSVVFENLPKLQSILLGDNTFGGEWSDDRITINKPPYNYKNTLTMKNLPSLVLFKGEAYNFRFIGSVILENIPRLSSSRIYFIATLCSDPFQYTYSLQSSSTHSSLLSSFDAAALESFIESNSKYV